jgi:hypothetical protein
VHNSVRPMIVMRRRRRPFSPHGESRYKNRRANVNPLPLTPHPLPLNSRDRQDGGFRLYSGHA